MREMQRRKKSEKEKQLGTIKAREKSATAKWNIQRNIALKFYVFYENEWKWFAAMLTQN